MKAPPKNPERAIARILGSRQAYDAQEIINEAMADSNTDIVPDEDEALAILEKRALEIIEEQDDEDVNNILLRLGMAQLDQLTLNAELANVQRKAVRGALKQIAREIKDGTFYAPPQQPTELRVEQRDQDQVMSAVRELEDEMPGALHSIARRLRPKLRFMNPEFFSRAVLALGRKGKLVLHHHDYPASLTDEEREAMVTDGKTYYIGVALPQ